MGSGEDQGTKEFDPSASKLRNLRNKGSVPKSPELNQLLSFIVAVSFLLMGSGFIWTKLEGMFIGLYSVIPFKTLDQIGAGFIVKHSVEIFAVIILPMLFLVGFFGAMGDIMQTGIMITFNQLTPNFNKLNPVTYFKNLFSVKKIVELLKQIGKLSVLGVIAYQMIQKHFLEMLTLTNTSSILVVGTVLKSLILDFTIKAAIFLLVITLIDVFYQKFHFTQENRMTRKEMMDEYKQNEGDPMLKQQRRAMARKYSQGEQLKLVPEADFITTNPSKIAVAVKYNSSNMKAPKILAKGSDAFAWQIITIAKKHNIPVIENIPLARALFKLVKIGAEVPSEFYKAVAEVLLFAYQLRGKKSEKKQEKTLIPK